MRRDAWPSQMAAAAHGLHHADANASQCLVFSGFHHRKERRKMDDPRRVGIAKFDSTLDSK